MPLRLGAVILAAGLSSRMGKSKPLLPWGDTTVLGHLIAQWKDLETQQIAVVCAFGDEGIQSELDRLLFPAVNRISNPAPEQGMFSSIQCAARSRSWEAGLTHWAIVLGDQPHTPKITLARLLEFSGAHPDAICVPRQGGHRRHPVFLPQKAFALLANCRATDLKQFLDTSPVKVECCDLNDPALELDIDYPEDYSKAMRLYL